MARACEKNVIGGSKPRSLQPKKPQKGFSPFESGFQEKEAIQEAQRCLGVRECESCDLCGLLCPDLCITRNQKTGEVLIDLDYCKGCGICAFVCPKGAIQMVMEEGV